MLKKKLHIFNIYTDYNSQVEIVLQCSTRICLLFLTCRSQILKKKRKGTRDDPHFRRQHRIFKYVKSFIFRYSRYFDQQK